MAVKSHFESDAEVEALVRGFESCELKPELFGHAQHLAVVSYYLTRMAEEEATCLMRDGLHKYIDAHGVDRRKYHETITRFWVKIVRNFLGREDKERAFTHLLNELLKIYGDSKLIFEYYSQELISSDAARLGWVEPDLKPLDFNYAESSQTSISS